MRRAAVAVWGVAFWLLASASQGLLAQPPDAPGTGKAPRRWEVGTAHRHRTVGRAGDKDGRIGWDEHAVGVAIGAFLPGPGFARGGGEYVYTRFALSGDTGLGVLDAKIFEHIQEIRLSAQLRTPLSARWSSQVFGAVTSSFESGAAVEEALNGIAALGLVYRMSDRLSSGFGGLLLQPLGSQAATVVPIVLLDWQITERLALRSRRAITLSYLIDARRRLSVAGVASFFGRKQFRLNATGPVPGGVVGIRGFEVGGRLTWRAETGLTLNATVEAVLGQGLRLEDRTGRELADVDLGDAVRLGLAVSYRF